MARATASDRNQWLFKYSSRRGVKALDEGVGGRLARRPSNDQTKHPWTSGQGERINRIIKDATVKRYHYSNHDQLRQHLTDFVAAYSFGRRLKILKGLTPYEAICKAWQKDPACFISNPHHQIPGVDI